MKYLLLVGLVYCAACGGAPIKPVSATRSTPAKLPRPVEQIVPYPIGQNSLPNQALIEQELRAACDGGSVLHCVELAKQVRRTNPSLAQSLYRAACARSEQEGCVGVALSQLTAGTQVSADVIHMLQVACDSGNFHGCLYLGFLLHRGYWHDPAVATEVYVNRACNMRPAACVEAAFLFFDDEPSRAPYFRKACDRGSPHGCLALAVLLKDSDEAGARTLMQLACDRGLAWACEQLHAVKVGRWKLNRY